MRRRPASNRGDRRRADRTRDAAPGPHRRDAGSRPSRIRRRRTREPYRPAPTRSAAGHRASISSEGDLDIELHEARGQRAHRRARYRRSRRGTAAGLSSTRPSGPRWRSRSTCARVAAEARPVPVVSRSRERSCKQKASPSFVKTMSTSHAAPASNAARRFSRRKAGSEDLRRSMCHFRRGAAVDVTAGPAPACSLQSAASWRRRTTAPGRARTTPLPQRETAPRRPAPAPAADRKPFGGGRTSPGHAAPDR